MTETDRRANRNPAGPWLRADRTAGLGADGRTERVEARVGDVIAAGVLAPGERLPSEIELARLLGVAPVTVRAALDRLRHRGLVVTRRGRSGGSFVADRVDVAAIARHRLAQLDAPALRDLAVHYIAVASAALSLAAGVADPAGVAPLRRRVAAAEHADGAQWSRLLDAVLLDMAALSGSERLTAEQARLQLEYLPLLDLVFQGDRAERAERVRAVLLILDALERGDAPATVEAFTRQAQRGFERLVELAGHTPPPPSPSR
ncbi:GntR family transcriptional regulator [Mycetocola reblochoni]|uniref:GntR family transcriptional regulator n=1 Tax=Mycetocola reblochoni TaxID=331618 RepID=UPI0023EA6996|nr:GntR family transcriptional regulator [Mycetocola reblochoni]